VPLYSGTEAAGGRLPTFPCLNFFLRFYNINSCDSRATYYMSVGIVTVGPISPALLSAWIRHDSRVSQFDCY